MTAHEIHLRLRSHRYRVIVTLVPIKPVLFLEHKFACVHRGSQGLISFSYRFWFCSHGYTIVSVVNISHQNKQKKPHLLTKFNKHRRTRGKFILLNLKSIGKIVGTFAFKIYRIIVYQYKNQDNKHHQRKRVFLRYQQNENLQSTTVIQVSCV